MDPDLYAALADRGVIVRDRDDGYLYRMPGLDQDRDAASERGRQNVIHRQDRPVTDPLPEPEYRAGIRAFYKSQSPHKGGIEPPLAPRGHALHGRAVARSG